MGKTSLGETLTFGESGSRGRQRGLRREDRARVRGAAMRDSALYARCLRDKVHFEVCPTSSILTGAQPLNYFYHAVCR